MFFKRLSGNQKVAITMVMLILFVDMLLYSLIIPITPFIADRFHANSTMIGLLFGIYAIAVLITTPFIGAWSDRMGRKIPIITGLICMALSTLLFAFAQTFTVLLIARFLQGVAAAASWTTAFALLADFFKAKDRQVAIGVALGGIEAGSLLGAPLGGWLFDIGGYVLPFISVSLLVLLIMIINSLFLPTKSHVRPTINTSRTSPLTLMRFRSIMVLALIVIVIDASFYMLEPILPEYFQEQFHFTPFAIGLMFGLTTITYIIAAPASSILSDRIETKKIMIYGIAGIVFSLPLLIITKSLWFVLFAMALLGVAYAFTVAPLLTLLSESAESENASHGSIYAVYNMCHTGGMIIGPIFGGLMTDVFSVPLTLMLTSLFVLMFAVVSLGSWRRQET